MRVRRIVFLILAACDSELLAGEPYTPDNRLPIAEPTDRSGESDAAADAAIVDAAPLPVDDASTPPTNTCMTARAIGTLSADTAGPALTTTGTCSEWISLRATEDASSGVPMTVTLTLTPAAGFDVFAFFDPVRDALSCTGPRTSPLSWGEGSVPNGGDDGRTIRIGIVRKGPCAGGPSWTLTARGHR